MEKVKHEAGTILDDRGNPVKKKTLTQEIAKASLTGVRNIWHNQSVASGLTPQHLAQILMDAANNNAEAYLILAEEMEEKDLHYASVLGTRKRAVSGLDVIIESASDEDNDIELADAVRQLVRAPEFGDMVDDALDGLGKGYSVVEIVWNTKKQPWVPKEYIYRDPRFFKFDQDTGRKLMLIDEQNVHEGIALEPYKFIEHKPKLKSGIPIRGGLARLAAVAYMCKSYSVTDWLAFAETFGMPLRIGKHGPNATEDEIRTLISAVANIGSDAAAVIPENMRIDFENSGTSSGGDKLFQNLAEWLDRQVSKGVLGQTMTSDDGSSQAQANVHNDVRKDILISDAKQLQNTLNRDLIKPFIDLNFGVQESYPLLTIPVPEPEDLKLLSGVLKELVPLGLRVEESQVRDKLGFTDPEEGAVLLTAPGTKVEASPIGESALNHQTALNQEQQDDYLDDLEREAMNEWEAQMKPIVDPIQKLADDSQDADEFLARLPELFEQMDTTEIVQALAVQTFKARGLGDAKDA